MQLDEDWPVELSKHPDAAIEPHPSLKGQVLYRGLRVRMGVHYGEPRAERDPITTRMDYFGPMVNRSARVEGATHGFAPCKPEYGDTVKRTFDYVDTWLKQAGRFSPGASK